MFNFDLKNLFSSIGVGIAATILLAYFYFLIAKLFNKKLNNENAFISWFKTTLERQYSGNGYAIIISVLIYSLGILTQDLTDYMVDSDDNNNYFVDFVQKISSLDKKSETRVTSLVRDKDTLTGLGIAVFGDKKMLKSLFPNDKDNLFNTNEPITDYWAKNGKDLYETSRFNGFVDAIYYTSKNWCYLNSPPIKEELDIIQNRMDFERSIYIESLTSFLLLLFIFIIYYSRELSRKKKKDRFMVDENGSVYHKVFYPTFSICILFATFVISRQCYNSAVQNYNQRAIGYYLSYLYLEENKPVKPEKPVHPTNSKLEDSIISLGNNLTISVQKTKTIKTKDL